MKVVIDTNVLIYAAKQKIDIVSQIKHKFGRAAEIIVPAAVIDELNKLAESARKGADKSAAKLALQLIKFSKLKVLDFGEGHTDDQILRWTKENKAAVATADKELKQKLKSKGVPLFQLRNN